MTAARKEAARQAIKRWSAFLGIAVAALTVVLLPFIMRGNYLAWSGAWADGISQHATFLRYMFGKNMYGGVGGYDHKIGLGADYITSFAYYMLFDPVNLLLYLLPRGNFLLAYSLLIGVRFLLSAVCMYIYLRRRKVRQAYSVLFSVAYMLSGYMTVTFVRHPDLTAGAMYLPLIVLGIEQAIDKKRPYVLVVFVFLTAISSFYMAYMVTLYAVAYAALYYCAGVKKRGEKVEAKKFFAVFFRVAGYYALGLTAASFVLLPVAYGYLHGARSGGKGLSVFMPSECLDMAVSFFGATFGVRYTPVMFNIATLLLAFVAIAVTRNNAHRILSLALALCLFIPFAGYIMNLCNYANNRYTYMLSFSVFALIAQYAEERKELQWRPSEVRGMRCGLCIFAAVFVNLGVWTGVEKLYADGHVALGTLGLPLALVILCLSVWSLHKLCRRSVIVGKVAQAFTCKRLLCAFAALTLCGAVGYCAVYSSQFDDGKRFAAYGSAAEHVAAQAGKDDFVRLDTHLATSRDISNRPLYNGYYGTSVYNTMFASGASSFVTQNNVVTFSSTLGMSGLNGRRALQAILGVKYYRADADAYVPNGFKPAREADGLYETQKYIPFGAVFSQTMAHSEWLALPQVERQYALLQAAVTKKGDIETEYSRLSQDAEVATEDFVCKKGKSVRITLPAMPEHERYVSFSLRGMPETETVFTFSGGALSYDIRVAPKGQQMYTGQKTFLCKTDENADTLTFTVRSGSSLSVCDIKTYAARYSDIDERIAVAAAQPHLQNVRMTDTRIEGKIVSDGGAMLFPIAYSNGFTAHIDGKRTPVFVADGGLTAISVPAGEHTVLLTYRTPWLSAGLLLSCISLLGIAALFIGKIVYARLHR